MSNCTINITEEKVVEEFHSGLKFERRNFDGPERIRVWVVDENGNMASITPYILDFILRDGKWEIKRHDSLNPDLAHIEPGTNNKIKVR